MPEPETSSFIHLHNHSDFSLLKGASPIKGMVARAKELGMDALAITDDGNLFGALNFYMACRNAEIKPIIGCDFYLAPGDRRSRSGLENPNRLSRLVLLAENNAGYQSLIRLSSIGYTEGFYYKPRIDDEVLSRYTEGVIALSGSLSGEIPRLILSNKLAEAEERAKWYRELYGPDRFYLELCDHGIPEQKVLNKELLELSEKLGIPMVAANDTHYLRQEDANAQDILLCIGSNKKKNDAGRFRFSTDQFYLKSEEEMRALFQEYPGAIENSRRIAEMCELEIELPGPKFPNYEIPERFETRDDYLRHLTWEGLRHRYEELSEEITGRAEKELDIIISMGFTGYFLIVWDFIKYARDNGVPVGPGRGSGAGSIVAYALQITDIDPLHYGLLFERFLNPDRVSMPDFDIDFCFERRQEVIDYVTRKYGTERVGQIITFGTLKAKAVIRDVARVLDLPYSEADQIAKLVPKDLKMTIEKALEQEPKLTELYEKGGVYRELIDVSRKLEGLHRHASTHAAGIVIGQEPLTHYVPLYRDPKTGSISTQYTMDLLEECGLVKMDFLGLKTLTLIENTVRIIHDQGIELDIDAIPEDDGPTFKMLGEGKSAAIFQFESEGMQGILERAKPRRIEDLIALNALYRPGPMQFIDQFIDSKNGRIPISYPLPELEPVLEETYGVIVYQEQVMEIVQIVGGFSLGQADILRRAMGKKKEKEMERMRKEFLAGAKEKGFSKEQAESIFELLKPFAGYGFNKSHAAAYSVVAYKTAYLKANYPVEFMAANLTNEINNPDAFANYLAETRGMNIEVLPPDINLSRKVFSVNEGRVVFGLVGIKNVGSAAVDEIVSIREEEGPYRSVEEFLERVDLRTVNRKTVETLIQSGVFDSLRPNRAELMHNLDRLLETATAKKEARAFGQASLFESNGEEEFRSVDLEPVEEWDQLTKLQYERENLGFYVSGHPIDAYRELWKKSVTLDMAHPERAPSDRPIQALGLLKGVRVVNTRKGTQMAFGTIEDFRGSLEIVLFSEALELSRDLLVEEQVVGVIGTVDQRNGKHQIVVEELRPPEGLEERDATEVHIRLANFVEDEEQLYGLRAFLIENPGSAQLYIHIGAGDKECVVRASGQIMVSSRPEVLERIKTHPQVDAAWKI
ncbi:MAG: DNA polymerase III subunit alpha [Alkalispirochaetaceae bacterium]